MLLQATLNGALSKSDHPAVPISAEELARDAAACVGAGAGAIHLHPRDNDGRESFDPEVVDRVVLAVRAAAPVPVGVSTGAWIEPDVERRVALIRRWRAPDYASVNIQDDGSVDVMLALLDARIGIEAGVWCVEDVERLAASGLGDRVLRLMIEPVDARADQVRALADDLHRELARHGLTAPALQHGDGEATWPFLTDAVRRGVDTRIGLEDTFLDPDGGLTSGNHALVRDARRLGAGG